MGLLPQIILGALLIVAFALSAQQRLALNPRTGPMRARQIAYLMRAHHQAAVNAKMADNALTNEGDYAPPTMTTTGDYTFVTCIGAKTVVTGLFVIGDDTTLMALPLLGNAENNAVVAELRRQSVLPPELGSLGGKPWAVGYNASPAALIAPTPGVGLAGEVPASAPCLPPGEAPVIVTQVLP
jgi:hypothetical protein